MIALEVLVNGAQYRTIGAGEFGMATAEVSWVCIPQKSGAIFEQVNVSGRGLESAGKPGLLWNREPLKVGDVVTIRIVETDKVDPPDGTTGDLTRP